ncbi:MAG: hypothetical protein ACLGIR_09260 [Actinomycetes bacterium]
MNPTPTTSDRRARTVRRTVRGLLAAAIGLLLLGGCSGAGSDDRLARTEAALDDVEVQLRALDGVTAAELDVDRSTPTPAPALLTVTLATDRGREEALELGRRALETVWRSDLPEIRAVALGVAHVDADGVGRVLDDRDVLGGRTADAAALEEAFGPRPAAG